MLSSNMYGWKNLKGYSCTRAFVGKGLADKILDYCKLSSSMRVVY